MTVTMSTPKEDQGDEDAQMVHAALIEECIGSFGRWQLNIFFFAFLVNLPLSMQELSITLLAHPLNFECSDNSTEACSKDCPSIVWDTEIFKNTIGKEFELICDRQWLESFAQTILMLGIFVGNVGFGFVSDRIGRRIPLLVAVGMQMCTGIVISFLPTFWLFLLFRFLVAVAAGGTLCTAFVIVVETTGRKYRSLFGILFQMTYYTGQALLGLIGYLIRDWRYVQLTISIPVFALVIYYWVIPEPPRYLLSVGRLEEAVIVLENAAKVNKLPVEPIREKVMTTMASKKMTKNNFLDLWRTPNIRKKTICIYINWAILGLSFFGVAQYIGFMDGNTFLNISVSGLIQIPGNIFIIYTIDKWGRKLTIFLTYAICGISCLLIIIVPEEQTWAITMLGCLSMMGISLSFATMFVWSGEIFATPVRNVGMGSAAMCAKFGSMVAPFLVDIQPDEDDGTDLYWVPPFVFGIAPLLAIGAAFFLPETVNDKMPDSILEAEKINRKTAGKARV